MNKIAIPSTLDQHWGCCGKQDSVHCKSQIVVSAKYYSCVTTILMLTQRMQWTSGSKVLSGRTLKCSANAVQMQYRVDTSDNH